MQFLFWHHISCKNPSSWLWPKLFLWGGTRGQMNFLLPIWSALLHPNTTLRFCPKLKLKNLFVFEGKSCFIAEYFNLLISFILFSDWRNDKEQPSWMCPNIYFQPGFFKKILILIFRAVCMSATCYCYMLLLKIPNFFVGRGI